MAGDGKSFFYVNPLESWPEASEKNPGCFHVKAQRQAWFECSCCPPNIARLLTGLEKYIFSTDGSDIYVHLYIGCEAEVGSAKLVMETDYPRHGNIKLIVTPKEAAIFSINLRIPFWCKSFIAKINGEIIDSCNINKGYLKIHRTWKPCDEIIIELQMTARMVRANKNVRANAGKAAVVRGPVVYCLEEADNGSNLSALRFVSGSEIKEKQSPAGGDIILHTLGKRDESPEDALYFPLSDEYTDEEITLTPYAFWGNRGIGEMTVWLPVI
jgi:hypothetical protein